MTWAGPLWFSRAKQRHAESPVREIGVQRNGLLVLGYGLLMLAFGRSEPFRGGMSDREIGVELNGLPSEPMRAFEGGGAQMIFIQRVEPSSQVSMGKHGIGPSVVRVEGDGALEETTRFIKVGHVGRRQNRRCRCPKHA